MGRLSRSQYYIKYMKKISKVFVGLVLMVLCFVLFPIATIFNYIVVCLKKKTIDDGYFKDSALRFDVYGCGEYRATWNAIMINKDGNKFQKDGRTISFYLGLNEANGALSFFGRLIAFILNTIDKNHCKRAYENGV